MSDYPEHGKLSAVPAWTAGASDGAIHGKHDGLHGATWAYAEDRPHGGSSMDKGEG